MMMFDGTSLKTEDGDVGFATGCGPCCEGKFQMTIIEKPKTKNIKDLKAATVTMTRADLIKLKTMVDQLLSK